LSNRNSNPEILPIIAQRWSPRAFDESGVPEAALELMVEAASLAPSAFNAQPWTFIYSLRNDSHWEVTLSLLLPFNRQWAQSAGALIFVVSDTLMRSAKGDSPLYSHSFDCGAACALLALQANALDYFTHAMTGFDVARAYEVLQVPPDHRIEAVLAVGRRGNPASLPQNLQSQEAPSGRKPASSIIRSGRFSV
jgi:nitroreductase